MGFIGMKDAVLHFTVIDNQNGQDPIVRQRQKFDLPKRRMLPFRYGDYTRQARNIGKQIRYRIDQRFRIVLPLVELQLHLSDFAFIRWPVANQGVDEKAVASRRLQCRHGAIPCRGRQHRRSRRNRTDAHGL